MKRITLLTLSFVLSFSFLQAKTVDVEKAVNMATKTIGENQPQKGIGVSAVPKNHLTLIKTASPESNYYVFNKTENNGFVIISGDDVAKPVLGYSDKGNFDENNLPPALVYWLNFLNKEIAYATQNNLPTNPEWNNLTSIGTASVEPLLTTQWNQIAPYNNFCPEILEQKAQTGCVATAMAQIMKYYNYPPSGIGQSEAYTTNDGVDLPSVDFEIEYDWGSMLNYYFYYGMESYIEKNAVATLMYHCGVSVKTDYNLTGSGAFLTDAAKALVNTFRYDRKILVRDRFFYSNGEWENMLKEQIDRRLPVMYRGADTEGYGHIFVCDGYDMGYFHFNWGWGGNYDGYFVTTVLNPYNNVTYNAGQMMVINIMPEEGGEPLLDILMWPETNLSSSQSAVNNRQRFTITGSFWNSSFFTFNGHIGIALVDDEDQIIEIIGQQQHSIPLRLGRQNEIFSVSVSSNVTPGDYKIRIVAKQADGNDWTIVHGTNGYTDVLDLTVKNSVGILDVNSFDNITVYPNPAEDIVYISGENIFSVEIKDLSGRIIKQSNETTISVKELQSGIYLFVIQTESGIVTKKIVKK